MNSSWGSIGVGQKIVSRINNKCTCSLTLLAMRKIRKSESFEDTPGILQGTKSHYNGQLNLFKCLSGDIVKVLYMELDYNHIRFRIHKGGLYHWPLSVNNWHWILIYMEIAFEAMLMLYALPLCFSWITRLYIHCYSCFEKCNPF